jgi:hypothetical protein
MSRPGHGARCRRRLLAARDDASHIIAVIGAVITQAIG